MYKTKVWLYKKESDIPMKGMSLSVDCNFIKPPEENELISIDCNNAEDLTENNVWISYFGFGEYKVVKSENMFDPKIHDGFSYSVVAVKEF